MPNVERIIIASAPIQRVVMVTRQVYRWEDPLKTSTLLVLYMVLVYYNLVLPSMVCFQSPRVSIDMSVTLLTIPRSYSFQPLSIWF